MAARKKRKRTTAGGTRKPARPEPAPQSTGAGERLVVKLDEETGVGQPEPQPLDRGGLWMDPDEAERIDRWYEGLR